MKIDISNLSKEWDKDNQYDDGEHTWTWCEYYGCWWCKNCHMFYSTPTKDVKLKISMPKVN